MILRTLVFIFAFSVPAAVVVKHSAAQNAVPSAQAQILAAREAPMALTPRHQAAAQLTHQLFSKYAYTAKPDPSVLADPVFDLFVSSLDPQRMFLTQEDIRELAPQRAAMLSALRGQDLSPAVAIYTLWTRRALDQVAYAKSLLDQGFDFTENEKRLSLDARPEFPVDRAEANEVWRLQVKADWLRLKLAGQDEARIRETLSKRYDRLSASISKATAEEAVEMFLNAYGAALDPHSNYFAPAQASNFEMSMSLSLEGIGAILQEEEDTVVVRSLLPGGPALRSGLLATGDRVLAVGQGEDGTLVDVVGWRLPEVVGLIRGPGGTQVRLTLQAGEDVSTLRTVAIKREKVKIEDQAATHQIIEADGKKVGVITLPLFYQDFQARAEGKSDARSATADVAALIRKVKAQGVDALVMDLRGNGGGSLVEAVELTGLFIDVGPVVQVHDHEDNTDVQGDKQPGALWEGPLTVLVDRNSASASEIFAAAIQDYGRGLIVGEPTFGKGTVQSIIDLDDFGAAPAAGFGQVKLTVAQFFRISGKTTQRDGVIPDVSFPVTLDGDSAGESALENALPPSKIAPATYKPVGSPARLAPRLAAAHAQRQKTVAPLRWWLEDVARFRSERDQNTLSLNEDVRRAELAEGKAIQAARDAERARLGFFVPDRQDDDGLYASERSVAEQVRAEEQAKAAPKEDPLLREAVQVMVDALRLDASTLVLAKK